MANVDIARRQVNRLRKELEEAEAKYNRELENAGEAFTTRNLLITRDSSGIYLMRPDTPETLMDSMPKMDKSGIPRMIKFLKAICAQEGLPVG